MIERIKAEMERSRVSVNELARRIGVGRHAIYARLSGKAAIKPRDLYSIAAALGVPVEQLTGPGESSLRWAVYHATYWAGPYHR